MFYFSPRKSSSVSTTSPRFLRRRFIKSFVRFVSTVKDFNLLVSLNVFNETLMNDAVYKFKRYEDASLNYTGINRHEGEKVGLYNTVLSKEDFELLAKIQAKSL